MLRFLLIYKILFQVMQNYKDNFTVVPVLVGSLSPEKEAKYGRIFARYLADPNNLFIISSDFCHWGQRFRYTEYDERKGEIHESIKALDYDVSTYVIYSITRQTPAPGLV